MQYSRDDSRAMKLFVSCIHAQSVFAQTADVAGITGGVLVVGFSLSWLSKRKVLIHFRLQGLGHVSCRAPGYGLLPLFRDTFRRLPRT